MDLQDEAPVFAAEPVPTVGTDVVAERAILGAMMADPSLIPKLVTVVKPEDFYATINGELFNLIVSRFMRGEPTDEISMASTLADLPGGGTHSSFLSKIGGAGYLHTLMASSITPSSALYYADIVRKKALRRRVTEAAARIDMLARTGTNDPDELVDRAFHVIGTLNANRGTGRAISFRDAYQRAMQYMDEVARGATVSTGFRDLEALTGAPRPGQMIVIAGRPGSGKTVFGASIARNMAIRQNAAILYATLEMTVEEMALRNLAAEAQVNFTALRDRRLSDQEMDRIELTGARLDSAPFFTLDTPQLSVVQLNAEIAKCNAETPLAAVFVDYLQLVHANGKLVSRQEQVAELSRELKLSARENGLPIFVLAQLNRASEARSDKRPQLSDLRESGAVEQDADVVVMVHRPDYYDEYDRPGEADLMVVKDRHGPTGIVPVASQLQWMRFMDLAV